MRFMIGGLCPKLGFVHDVSFARVVMLSNHGRDIGCDGPKRTYTRPVPKFMLGKRKSQALVIIVIIIIMC